ncbi:MAG: phospho-N-acetylmuramoyl-pentapeptide-transferase [Candidatus Peregrinibacteria bacterium]
MEYVPQIIQIFGWFMLAFLTTLALTPLYLKLAVKWKLGKRLRQESMDGKEAVIFNEMHAKKMGTPTMGGVIMWGSVLLVILFSRALAYTGLIPKSLLDRGEVYLPIFTLVAVGLLGLVDDFFNIREIGAKRGIEARPKILLLTLFAALGAWWFYSKLGFSSIHIPRLGDFEIGLWYIPLFILVIVSTANAVNFTDGLDGLAGGLLILAFTAFGAIAFAKGLFILTIFCALLIGALLAFLWNNLPPALYYMGDTGALAFGATLGVIAMMTNSLVVLLVVGFVFIIETLSVIIQLLSKKFLGRKVFLIAPLHHHLEKIGWGEAKITMRFWIMGAIAGGLGLIIGLIGMGK